MADAMYYDLFLLPLAFFDILSDKLRIGVSLFKLIGGVLDI